MHVTESRHEAHFVVTGGTSGCHNDNLQRRQWQQSRHHDNSDFQWLYSQISRALIQYKDDILPV